MFRRPTKATPTIEQVRKNAQILVIDDHAFPYERLFQRDHYNIQRWASVKNMPALTDGDYQLILLDVQGVGLAESPDKQGFGILEHVKIVNPAQAVILYSSAPYNVSDSKYITLADGFLDKGASYIDYKTEVDRLLMAQTSPAYFVERMNQILAGRAVMAPKAVSLALDAFRRGNSDRLAAYLSRELPAGAYRDSALQVIAIGVAIVGLFTQ